MWTDRVKYYNRSEFKEFPGQFTLGSFYQTEQCWLQTNYDGMVPWIPDINKPSMVAQCTAHCTGEIQCKMNLRSWKLFSNPQYSHLTDPSFSYCLKFHIQINFPTHYANNMYDKYLIFNTRNYESLSIRIVCCPSAITRNLK